MKTPRCPNYYNNYLLPPPSGVKTNGQIGCPIGSTQGSSLSYELFRMYSSVAGCPAPHVMDLELQIYFLKG